MDYTVKLAYQSNYWYNDGLAKAQVRDMSGAITSLKKSLQYNRANLAARNLLGLVYYGRGDVIEALVEWILSKNFQPKDNIASFYQQSTGDAGRTGRDQPGSQTIQSKSGICKTGWRRSCDYPVKKSSSSTPDLRQGIPASGIALY